MKKNRRYAGRYGRAMRTHTHRTKIYVMPATNRRLSGHKFSHLFARTRWVRALFCNPLSQNWTHNCTHKHKLIWPKTTTLNSFRFLLDIIFALKCFSMLFLWYIYLYTQNKIQKKIERRKKEFYEEATNLLALNSVQIN